MISRNLYILLVAGTDDFSEEVREIVRYAAELVESEYGLTLEYREIVDEAIDFPYMVVNGLDPIVFEEKPSLKTVVNIFLITANIAGPTNNLLNPNNSSEFLTS